MADFPTRDWLGERGIGRIKEDSFPIPPRPDPFFIGDTPPDTTSSTAERNVERAQERADEQAREVYDEELRERAEVFLQEQFDAQGELNPDAESIEVTEEDVEATKEDLEQADKEKAEREKALTLEAFDAMKPALIDEIVVEVLARIGNAEKIMQQHLDDFH